MQPVVTPAEMNRIDAGAVAAGFSVATLIERAGCALAVEAARLLGSPYGKRVLVLAGKGNNGADGRAAAANLERRGARCTIIDMATGSAAAGMPADGRGFDLVIDACVGTGLSKPFDTLSGFKPAGAAVLAVDIASGVDGSTGAALGAPLAADVTVTFGAAKPGLLFEPGASLCGRVVVCDIGLGEASRAAARLWHLEASDLKGWPWRSPGDHKWRHAVAVVAGSSGMTGAATLCATAALRAGGGYVGLHIPGIHIPGIPASAGPIEPTEAVRVDRETDGPSLAEWFRRFGSAVVGPGLAAGSLPSPDLVDLFARTSTPTVIDASAITELSAGNDPLPLGAPGGATHVLTPHDGEFERLFGEPPGVDRVAAAQSGASRAGAVVVLKGPTTVVAAPDGRAALSTTGDQRLSTAGSGDVLAGFVAAALASAAAPAGADGRDSFAAACLAVELHGQAARRGHRHGLLAGDLPDLAATILSEACR